MIPGDGAQMSLDMLIGLSIFLFSFVVAATMAPGLYAGLQSAVIDYDAVAYRTGVILAEDAGMPSMPPWNSLGDEYLYRIERFGLAVDRQSPGILAGTKVDRFFDTSLFSYPEDYRRRLIFGSTPYRFNISLREEGGVRTVGDPLPDRYGYIRRIVSITHPASFETGPDPAFNATESDNVTEMFTVAFNGTDLFDPSIPAAYRIDPRSEPVWINITGIGGFLNNSETNPSPLANGSFTKATLSTVRFRIDGAPVPFPYSEENPEAYRFSIDGSPANLTPGTPVSEELRLLIMPGTLPVERYAETGVVFSFESDGVPAILIHGTGYVGQDHTVQPPLTRGVLEVAVW
ncbi:MAG: hypothetical protein ACP5C4_08795 [Methanomicrobiales archaeon]